MRTFRLICADVLDGLAELEAGSVHCVVTSPPYWGLRDYGTGAWDGGDPACDHSQARKQTDDAKNPAAIVLRPGADHSRCRCGAVRVDLQIGLEQTVDEYVVKMVEVFREVRRVLREDGTLWLNLGDSYNAYNGGAGPASTLSKRQSSERPHLSTGYGLQSKAHKPKDLIGVPWRVAFALQADGWWLRADNIWHKPNPMPESIRDRTTRAHEHVFMLTKSARYYYDAEAVRLPQSPESAARRKRADDSHREVPPGAAPPSESLRKSNGAGANLRSVWTIPTEGYPAAHFATFPTKLVEPCVLAGSPEGGAVLDPFAGSGTVGVVALRAGRSFVGIDLSTEYIELARRRILGDAPLLNREHKEQRHGA